MTIGRPKKQNTPEMNVKNIAIDDVSSASATREQTVQAALIALAHGDFAGVVGHFDEQFTFIDHAIELEFKEKPQLIEFLTLSRKLLPDSKRADNIICSSGNMVVSEWVLTGTKREHYFGRMVHVPFRAVGVSIVEVDNHKVSRWSEYYDQTLSRRYGVAAYLKEWTEL
jgi:SnoaL-like domain